MNIIRRIPIPITRPIVRALLGPVGEAVCWVGSWEVAVVIGMFEVAEVAEVVKNAELDEVDDGVGDDIEEVLEETGDMIWNPLDHPSNFVLDELRLVLSELCSHAS